MPITSRRKEAHHGLTSCAINRATASRQQKNQIDRQDTCSQVLYLVYVSSIDKDDGSEPIEGSSPLKGRRRPSRSIAPVRIMRRLNLVFLAILLAGAVPARRGHVPRARRPGSAERVGIAGPRRGAEASDDLDKAEQSLNAIPQYPPRGRSRMEVVRSGRRSAESGSPRPRSSLPGPRASPPI